MSLTVSKNIFHQFNLHWLSQFLLVHVSMLSYSSHGSKTTGEVHTSRVIVSAFCSHLSWMTHYTYKNKTAYWNLGVIFNPCLNADADFTVALLLASGTHFLPSSGILTLFLYLKSQLQTVVLSTYLPLINFFFDCLCIICLFFIFCKVTLGFRKAL